MACIHYRAGCTRSYISGVPGPDEEGTYGYARKSEKDGFHPLFPSSEKDKGGSPAPVRTFFSRSAYIVSSVYEAHFKTFTLLCLYVYDRYRTPRGLLPRDNSSTFFSADTGISGLYPGLRTESSIFFPFSPSLFHANLSSLSLNPRYPRADHLGNLSFYVDDISDPDRAWEPNDLSHDVEYIDISYGGGRSLPRVSNSAFLFSAVSQNPRVSLITYV